MFTNNEWERMADDAASAKERTDGFDREAE
jgi:hypothetical protein